MSVARYHPFLFVLVTANWFGITGTAFGTGVAANKSPDLFIINHLSQCASLSRLSHEQSEGVTRFQVSLNRLKSAGHCQCPRPGFAYRIAIKPKTHQNLSVQDDGLHTIQYGILNKTNKSEELASDISFPSIRLSQGAPLYLVIGCQSAATK